MADKRDLAGVLALLTLAACTATGPLPTPRSPSPAAQPSMAAPSLTAITQPPVASIVSTPSSPPPTATPSPVTWRELPRQLFESADLARLDASPSGLLIPAQRNVWASLEGERWQRTRLPGERTLVLAVSSGDTSFAGGYANLLPFADTVDPDSHGAIWMRPAEGEWDLHDLGPRTAIYDVAGSGNTVIAGGQSFDDNSCRLAVWLTNDEQSWGEPVLLGDQCGLVHFVDALTSGSVALSQVNRIELRAWHSIDAISWSSAASPENGEWTSLASLGGVAVAAGTSLRAGSQLWVYDGTNGWRQLNLQQSGLEDSEISLLTDWDGEFLAVGRHQGDTALWASQDGEHWMRSDESPPFDGALGLASAGSTVFVIDGSGSVWAGERVGDL